MRFPLEIDWHAVHVWTADLSVQSRHAILVDRLLDKDELARTNRFHRELDRNRYVASHGALRMILGSYLACKPANVRFAYTGSGKPIIDQVGALPLFFSLSHSGDVGAIAVTRNGPIGVDIERVRYVPDAADIAERFFSPLEQQTLSRLPDNDRSAAFLRCWTRKEAYVKAIGKGIGSHLGDFDVEFREGFRPQILTINGDAAAAAQWTLSDIRLRPDFVGALAVESTGLSERFFHFDPADFGQ